MILGVQGGITYFYFRPKLIIFQHDDLIMFWNALFKGATCERTNKTLAWWKEFEPCKKQPI